ncbi:MAG: hypothetical protein WB628_06700 [Candidatus Sulfotelmatobacter sp.]
MQNDSRQREVTVQALLAVKYNRTVIDHDTKIERRRQIVAYSKMDRATRPAIIVMPDGRVWDGFRRLQAAMLNGEETIVAEEQTA